jgi:mannose-1-phosphate guanylyltransferase
MIPKCLVPIKNKPLMGYWLEILEEEEITQIIVNTHYLPEQVRGYIAEHPLGKKVDLVHEESLLGTGGTILSNKNKLNKKSFLVAHADNLTRFNLANFIEAHRDRPNKIEITMMTFISDDPSSCGIVEVDENNIVVGFYEKVANPPGSLANAAVYIIEPSVIEFIESLGKTVVDFSTEVLPEYVGRTQTYLNKIYHRDIGTVASLSLANKDFPAYYE